MPRPGGPALRHGFHEAVQAWSERLMPDRCVITRHGTPVYDPVTNTNTRTVTTVFTGPCRIQDVQPFGGSRVQQFGDQPITTSSYFAVIPADAPEVRVEDVLTVTASADPDLTGRDLRVNEVLVDTFHAHRRLILEEAATPTGD